MPNYVFVEKTGKAIRRILEVNYPHIIHIPGYRGFKEMNEWCIVRFGNSALFDDTPDRTYQTSLFTRDLGQPTRIDVSCMWAVRSSASDLMFYFKEPDMAFEFKVRWR
jgi:hypothetical protein